MWYIESNDICHTNIVTLSDHVCLAGAGSANNGTDRALMILKQCCVACITLFVCLLSILLSQTLKRCLKQIK